MTALNENTSWDFWKMLSGLRNPYIVTEWNPQFLEDHLKSFPECHILFTAHMHDLLPRFIERNPEAEARVFVPGDGAKEYADTIMGRVSGIRTIELEKFFPRKSPSKKAKSFLIVNELHPLGGLVPASTIIGELRHRGNCWEVFEHQIPLREMFIPDRQWEIHNFPPSAADITFAWRKNLGIQAAPPDLDLGSCVVFYCPLHFTPPVSSAVWRCWAEGARIVTVNSPFTRNMSGEGIITYSPALLEEFDPFQKPPGSHINRALAEVITKEILPWIQ